MVQAGWVLFANLLCVTFKLIGCCVACCCSGPNPIVDAGFVKARIVKTDIKMGNCIVQVVDKVLAPVPGVGK